MELFAPLPENLSDLSTDELVAALSECQDTARRLVDPESDLRKGMSAEDVTAHVQTGVEQIEALKAEKASRDEADAQVARLAALAAEDEPEDDTSDDDGDSEGEQDADADASMEPAADHATQEPEPEPDAEPEPEPDAEPQATEPDVEPVAASGARRATVAPRAGARNQARGRGRDDGRPVARLTASRGLPGLENGETITSRDQLREAFIDAHDNVRGDGKMRVARFRAEYPDEFRMAGRDDAANSSVITRAIEAAQSDEAITAAGAFCAPASPRYELESIGVADRPVADSLPTVGAPRGSLMFAAATQASITDAIGIITQAEALAGGSTSLKTCQRVTCPSFTTVKVDSLYNCLTFDNLQARTWPEFVDWAVGEAGRAFARMAETAFLDAMDTAATDVTASGATGAAADLVKHVMVAAAGYRSRYRMDDAAPLQVWMPAWTPDIMLADVIRSQVDDRFTFTRESIAAQLAKANVRVTYYRDTTTGGGQVFGSQGAAGLLDFPSTVVWFITTPGAFVRLDTGVLDLGIVRDSALNEANDFQIFYESFEAVAFTGIAAYKGTSTVCDTGAVAAAVTVDCGDLVS